MKKTKRLISAFLLIVMIFATLATSVSVSAADEPACQRQWETKWKSYYYGGKNLYDTGCGIFSFCNAVYYLTGNNPSITEVAKWAYDMNALNGTHGGGTVRKIFCDNMEAKWGSKFGFTVQTNRTEGGTWGSSASTDLKNHLKSGQVVMGHVPGHFIAIVGYDESNNTFHVYDSAPSSSRGTNSNGGNVWVTQERLNTGKLKLDWYCKIYRTGSAPAWYGETQNIGDVFYAKITNEGYERNLQLASNNVVADGASTSNNQVWKFIHQDDNSYKIMNVSNNRYLTVTNGASANGTKVQVAAESDSSAQRWNVVLRDNGYALVPLCAPRTCLDIDTSDKYGVQIWEASSGTNQVFKIELVTGPTKNMGNSFYARIKNTAYSLYLGYNDDNLIFEQGNLADCSQIWKFQRQSNGSYVITNFSDGLALDVEGSGTDNQTKVLTCEAGKSAQKNQKWYISKVGDGYSLRPEHALLSSFDCYADKTPIIWQTNESSAQIMKIEEVTPYKDLGETFETTLYNKKNDKNLALSDEKISVIEDSESEGEVWKFTRQKDGSYTIANASSGELLTVKDNKVVFEKDNGSNLQKWHIIANGSGYSLALKDCANKTLTINSSGKIDTIELATFSRAQTQLFAIALPSEEAETTEKTEVTEGTEATEATDATEQTENTAAITEEEIEEEIEEEDEENSMFGCSSALSASIIPIAIVATLGAGVTLKRKSRKN